MGQLDFSAVYFLSFLYTIEGCLFINCVQYLINLIKCGIILLEFVIYFKRGLL